MSLVLPQVGLTIAVAWRGPHQLRDKTCVQKHNSSCRNPGPERSQRIEFIHPQGWEREKTQNTGTYEKEGMQRYSEQSPRRVVSRARSPHLSVVTGRDSWVPADMHLHATVPSLSPARAWNSNTAVARCSPLPRSSFLSTVPSSRRNQSSWKNDRLQGRARKVPDVPGTGSALDMGTQQRHRSQPDRAPTTESGTI